MFYTIKQFSICDVIIAKTFISSQQRVKHFMKNVLYFRNSPLWIIEMIIFKTFSETTLSSVSSNSFQYCNFHPLEWQVSEKQWKTANISRSVATAMCQGEIFSLATLDTVVCEVVKVQELLQGLFQKSSRIKIWELPHLWFIGLKVRVEDLRNCLSEKD